jgi:hypothetical protein
MHIIFGEQLVEDLTDKYTVLELDSFIVGDNPDIQRAYAIIENISLDQLISAEKMKELHSILLENYKQQKWDDCLDNIKHLLGQWGGEIDTFYDDLKRRVLDYQQSNPGSDWTPAILKPTT